MWIPKKNNVLFVVTLPYHFGADPKVILFDARGPVKLYCFLIRKTNDTVFFRL